MLTLPEALTHPSSAAFVLHMDELVKTQASSVVADAALLTQFDSSALAVLLECRRAALASGRSFSVHGLPARLRQLAQLYGVAALLPDAGQSLPA
jgi:phospholipid transport system transporter-binding protein